MVKTQDRQILGQLREAFPERMLFLCFMHHIINNAQGKKLRVNDIDVIHTMCINMLQRVCALETASALLK